MSTALISLKPARRTAARWVGFSPREISALVQQRVVREHASEAAWLWLQRERAVSSPHYRLTELAKLDARVTAHLRGLEVAGADGSAAALELLEHADAGAVFVSAYLAFSASDASPIRHALQLAALNQACEQAVVSAIGWAEPDAVHGPLLRLAASRVPLYRRLALHGLASHRLPCDALLTAALGDADPALRAAACETVGTLGFAALAPLLAQALSDPDASVQLAAAASALRFGHVSAAATLLEQALRQPEPPRSAVEVAVRCGEPEWSRNVLRRLAADPARRRLAIWAAGAIGDAATLPWLVKLTHQREYARLAGESVSMITGADLRYLDLHRDPPDESTELDEHSDDLHLVWPHPDALAAWCDRQTSSWRPGLHLLCGASPTREVCARVLRHGTQRQRAAAAIELARHEPERPLFAVRERADRQLRRLMT